MNDSVNNINFQTGGRHEWLRARYLNNSNIAKSCYSMTINIPWIDGSLVDWFKNTIAPKLDIGDFLGSREESTSANIIYSAFCCYENVAFDLEDKVNKKYFQLIFQASSKELLYKLEAKLEKYDRTQDRTSTWYYKTAQGGTDYVEIPLKKAKICTRYHIPWLKEDVTDFINRYNESESPILIILGNPGTGKSSLINYFIHEFKVNSMITYEQSIMRSDSFYIDFITSNKNLLVLEDADAILQQRSGERSEILSKMLNVGDGIIDISKKKIIITGNLESLNEIDNALSRKGRCFDILMSRNMSPTEAKELAEYEGLDREYDRDVSLAEFYNGWNPISKAERKVGF